MYTSVKKVSKNQAKPSSILTTLFALVQYFLVLGYNSFPFVQTLTLAGPQTGEVTETGSTTPANTGGSIGDCVNDALTISSPGFKSPPVICGENSGQHSKTVLR